MIIEVPYDPILFQTAKSNIENFIRDIACYPRTGISPFIRRRKKIDAAVKSYPNPFNPNTMQFIPDFKCTDKFRRYMHIDLGLKKDAVGISMTHVPRFIKREVIDEGTGKSKKIIVPLVKCDFWGRITVNRGEEIILADIRNIVYDLSRLGFYFGLITFDRFQSIDSVQILRNYGYTVGHLSVDRTANRLIVDRDGENGYKRVSTEGNYLASMVSLKDVLYDDRFEVPFSKNFYDTDWFVEECKQAQETKGKIDHPTTGTIDVMQSVAGSVYHAINNEIGLVVNESEADLDAMEDRFYNSSLEYDKRLMSMDDDYYLTQDPRDIR